MENLSNIEAEKSILGAIMYDSSIMADISLEPDYFYRGAHQQIFSAMMDLHDLGEPIDMVTVSERLKGKVEGLVGILTDIMTGHVTAANYDLHSRVVTELAAKRQIVRTCQEVQMKAQNGGELEELVSAMGVDVNTGKNGSISQVRDVTSKSLEQISERNNNKHDLSGVKSGFFGLDMATDGFQSGDLIIVAGRPSMGKTAFAGQIALSSQVPVHFVSVEMKNTQLAIRMLSSISNVEGYKIRKGLLKEQEMTELQIAGEELSKKRITFDDISFKLYDIRRSILQAHRMGARLVIVDYIQLIKNQAPSREREIGEISTMLKNTAKQLDVPIIALAQLNRSVESRENKRPMLSDLRDSGQIEQDADIVIFLHRPGYYNRMRKAEASDKEAQIIVAKGRNIGTDTITVGWDGQRTKFIETNVV
jgi:replicative DNA helicase